MKNIFRFSVLVLLCCNYSCKKLIDEKSNAKLVVPSTQKDLQAIMDDYTRVNNSDISCTEVSADDYYLTQPDFNSQTDDNRALYSWQPANIFRPVVNDWFAAYKIIYSANTVLELVDKVEQEPQEESANIRGQAFYHRAKSYLSVVSAWCPAFDSATAIEDLGLPLRVSTNFIEPSVRSSLSQTFALILSDCRQAAYYLQPTSVHVMRPSKTAAHALMARTLLYMRRYAEAGLYADSALRAKNSLLNYNSLNAGANFPVPQFNAEVIMENRFGSAVLLNSRAKIDSVLYAAYASNDLRKTVFFKNNNNGSYGFKGSYEGGTTFFSGISVNEVYLIKAECLARAGHTAIAMDTLNALLVKRWKTNTFIPYTASTAAEALNKILQERRKELLMRGIRWMDIKRLNKEGAGITLVRKINNETITLPPGDPRFALPIPEDVIALTGMQQNPR